MVPQVTPVRAGLVWYVAYGSNMAGARLRAYLEGDGPGGPFGAHRGCADATPPRADRWLALDRAVTHRGRSRRWGGGVAFLDLAPTPGTATPARAWLLGLDQVAGLVAQEARLGAVPDLAAAPGLPIGATLAVGGGWYDTVLRLPDLDGTPALTVTTAQPLPRAAPTAAYLATVAAGLAERPTGVGRAGTSGWVTTQRVPE